MSIIKVEHLSKSFNGTDILKDITVDINKGEVISIIGPSELEKSLFLKCLTMLEKPSNGNIIIDEQNLLDSKTDILKLRQKVGMISKSPNLYSHLMVIENIMLAPTTLLKMPKQEAFEEAMELLKSIGLDSKAYTFPEELTYGEQQRISIARTMAMKPEIILFDEPTAILDTTMVGEVLAVIKKLAQHGMTIVIATNEMEFAKDISTRVLYMDDGIIYEEGKPEDIFLNPRKEKTKAFIYKIKTLSKTFSPMSLDICKLNAEIEEFCFKNFVNKAKIYNVQLIVEELIWNILFPSFEDKQNNLQFDFSIHHKKELIEMIFRYKGKSYEECLNEDTILAQKLIERKAQNIDATMENDLNKLIVKLNTNDFVRVLESNN